MISKKVRYWASLILALTFFIGLIFPTVITSANANAGLTDITGHWAKDKITEWIQKGLVSGYTDGTFKPDKSITRAEFMILVNKAFEFNEKASIEFSDITAKDWFYEEVAKTVKAGYISGYQDGTVKPNREISRQEAAVALCKALKLEPQDAATKFIDIDSIPIWSRPYIGALVAKGYMGGYPDGSFKAERHITRAETVTMLDKALEAFKVSYDVPGVYGPEEGIETITQDVTINVPGVTLRNMIIEGNLYLNEGIGKGDVTLDNITVKGTTTVRGGGKDSIHLVNFTCEEVIVIKIGGEVRIVASGDTTVEELILESGAHIEGNGIASVTVLKPGEDVILDGDFTNVIIEADVNIEVLEGTTIDNLQINSKADINLDKGATIKDLTIEAAATITGKGTIEAAKINADGATLETEPKKYEMAKDVTTKIAGKEVKESKDSGRSSGRKSSGGGGGGSDEPTEPTVIEVQSVSLDRSSVILAVYESVYGKTVTLTATIDPDNATNKKVTWSSNNKNVATVTDNGLKATVKAVSEGKATITVKTDDGGKTAKCIVTVVGDETPVVSVSAISVDGVVKVGETLTAKADGQPNLTATYKWMRADVEDGDYVAIDGATNKTYELVEADEGKWIKVEVKGTGNYTGTKTKVVGPVGEEVVGPEEVTRTVEPTRADATGGTALEYAYENGTVTISAPIADIPESTNPNEVTAKWVGVNIPVPAEDAGIADEGTIHLTIKEEGKDDVTHENVSYGEGDPFLYYFGALEDGRIQTLEIVWNGTHKETLVVKYVDTTEPVGPEEVTGSMTAFGEGEVDGDTATFTGEIAWYEADETIGRAEGNRVGVKLIAPEGFSEDELEGVTFKIGETTYNWPEIQDGEFYFEWWPLVTEESQEFAGTVKWNEVSEQTFTIKVENATLEDAPEVPEETIAANVDYNAVWNETRDTWYIEVSVPDEDLDAESVQTIKVIKEAGEALDEPRALTPDTDTMMWFGVAKGDGDLTFKANGEYAYEVVRKDGSKYIFNFTYDSNQVDGVEEEPETASFESTGSYGINNNKVYAGYKLMADEEQIDLVANNIASMTVMEPGATEAKTLTVGDDTDPCLWFNIAKEAGTYTYTVVTKGEDAKTYEATIEWVEPTEATVNFQAPESARDVFTEAGDNPAQVDFSKVTADKLLDWTSTKDGYYAIELKIGDVNLSADNVKKAFRVYEGGTAIEPEIKGDLDTQYVTTDWELGTATMYYVLADNSLHKAVINFVNKTPKTALSEQSTYKLTHTGLAESYTAGELIDVTGKTQEDINTAVEETIVGLEPVKVTLVNDVLGETGYDAVRIQPVNAGENIQLWAKDTSHNWYDINVTGWGPGEGFALPATYDVTTDIYILSDKAGDYELAIKLVDLSDDGVIAEASGMVSVSTVEVTNAGGLNTALADNNVKIIKFAGDITLSEQVNIVRDIVIDGQDKQLTGNADLRAFHVNKESIDVTIQNINFDTFLQGTTVNIVGTITIKNNIYTNVHRCIDMNGIGFTSDNVTITENKFNLGDGKRAVSYAVKAAKADIQNILDNNYFKDEDDPDNLIRYYSGRSNVYLINSPIENGTIECDGGVTINVANKEDPYGGDADILGTITVTGEITDEALIAALNTKAKDFVDEITIKDSDSKVYIKSFDGKDTCYYEIENSNGGVEGA